MRDPLVDSVKVNEWLLTTPFLIKASKNASSLIQGQRLKGTTCHKCRCLLHPRRESRKKKHQYSHQVVFNPPTVGLLSVYTSPDAVVPSPYEAVNVLASVLGSGPRRVRFWFNDDVGTACIKITLRCRASQSDCTMPKRFLDIGQRDGTVALFMIGIDTTRG